MVFHGADPTTFLALATVVMAIATSLLAGFTYLSVRAFRRQTSVTYWLGQLENLYTPLHERILRYQVGLGEAMETAPSIRSPSTGLWEVTIEPLMLLHGHLATEELYEIYEEIVQLGGGAAVEDREARRLSFNERAEADYRTIRRNLR